MPLRRFSEHLTFGLRIHYLLRVLILEFGTLFLTYQFARPLTVPVQDGRIFQGAYALLSLFFLTVTVVFVRNMCERTFDSKLHSRTHIFLAAGTYLLVSAVAVLFGFMSLVVASSSASVIDISDVILATFFTTIFSALLAVGYHDRFESVDHPTQTEINKVIEDWLDSATWVEKEEGSFEKREELADFEQQTNTLSSLLSHAKTARGQQLKTEFDEWSDSFNDHEPFGKEIIIAGQDNRPAKNKQLHREHRAFLGLKRKLSRISNQDDD